VIPRGAVSAAGRGFNDETGQPLTVLYHLLPAMLLNEVRRQDQELVALRQVVEELRTELRGRRP
jgi:hypothetical protein